MKKQTHDLLIDVLANPGKYTINNLAKKYGFDSRKVKSILGAAIEKDINISIVDTDSRPGEKADFLEQKQWVQKNLVPIGIDTQRKLREYRRNGGYFPPNFNKVPESSPNFLNWPDYFGRSKHMRGGNRKKNKKL